jgi:hypothetical protein
MGRLVLHAPFMKELIDQITSKLGVSEEQATQAVQIVSGFLKEKLPAPVATELERALGGEAPAEVTGVMSKIAAGLGLSGEKKKTG